MRSTVVSVRFIIPTSIFVVVAIEDVTALMEFGRTLHIITNQPVNYGKIERALILLYQVLVHKKAIKIQSAAFNLFQHIAQGHGDMDICNHASRNDEKYFDSPRQIPSSSFSVTPNEAGIIIHLKSLCRYDQGGTNQEMTYEWAHESIDNGLVTEVQSSALVSARFISDCFHKGEVDIEKMNRQLNALAFKIITDKQRIKPPIFLENENTVVIRSVYGESGDLESILLALPLFHDNMKNIRVLGDGFLISYRKKELVSFEDLEVKYNKYLQHQRNTYRNILFEFETPKGMRVDLFQK
ncbi:MAG: hypothetical protein H0T62_06330 [Parachlamydiaceae bacterium]|nr:hypothetical protein [Parachlamydiaceae bacterium]